jgi:diadenosine tetraphosphatase ApaH/serine/threonine PP2A family protein phosphatase
VRWTADRLGRDRIAWLAGLAMRVALPTERAVAVHATPRSDEELLFPDTPEPDVRAMLGGVDQPLVLCGHTHRQYRRAVEPFTVVNPGSVGLPDDGDPRAAWAVLDDGEVELRRTAYPVEEAVRRMEASGSPVTRRSVVRFRTARDPG